MSEAEARQPAHDFYEQMMSKEFDRRLTPEAWVARYRHTLHLGGIFDVRYESADLDEWVQAVGAIVYDNSTDIDALRRRHLSFSERGAVRSEQQQEAEFLTG